MSGRGALADRRPLRTSQMDRNEVAGTRSEWRRPLRSRQAILPHDQPGGATSCRWLPRRMFSIVPLTMSVRPAW